MNQSISPNSEERGVFVTADAAFVKRVIVERPRHSGVIHFSPELSDDTRALVAPTFGVLVKEALSTQGSMAFYEIVLIVDYRGFDVVEKGKRRQLYSWEWFFGGALDV